MHGRVHVRLLVCASNGSGLCSGATKTVSRECGTSQDGPHGHAQQPRLTWKSNFLCHQSYTLLMDGHRSYLKSIFFAQNENLTKRKKLTVRYTVEPPIMDTPKSGQPPYNGQTPCPLSTTACAPYITNLRITDTSNLRITDKRHAPGGYPPYKITSDNGQSTADVHKNNTRSYKWLK